MQGATKTPPNSTDWQITSTTRIWQVQHAFDSMSPATRDFLWDWLEPEGRYVDGEIPDRHTRTGANFLWHELLHASRQADGPFFIVSEIRAGEQDAIFVSSDWVAAREFIRTRILDQEIEQSAEPKPAKKPALNLLIPGETASEDRELAARSA